MENAAAVTTETIMTCREEREYATSRLNRYKAFNGYYQYLEKNRIICNLQKLKKSEIANFVCALHRLTNFINGAYVVVELDYDLSFYFSNTAHIKKVCDIIQHAFNDCE